MAIPSNDRSFSELLSDALSQFSALIRSEIHLARAELTDKATRAGIGLAFMAASAGVAIAALVLFLFAVAAALAGLGVPDWLANLIAGIVGAAISGGLAWAGMQRMKADELTPKRTLEQLQHDATAAKEQVK